MKIINFKRFSLPYAQFNVAILFMVAVAGVFVLTKINLEGAFNLLHTSISQLEQWKIWTLATHIFFNSSVLGLIFYVMWLFFFGIPLERGMGSWQFLLFYIGSGVVSALISFLLFQLMGFGDFPIFTSAAPTIAMIVAFACFNPDAQISIMFVIPIRAVFSPLITIGIMILISFADPFFLPFLVVKLVGFGVGILFMLIFYKRNYFKYF